MSEFLAAAKQLADACPSLNQATSLDRLAETLKSVIFNVFEASAFALGLFKWEEGPAMGLEVRGTSDTPTKLEPGEISTDLAQWIVAHGKALCIPVVSADARHFDAFPGTQSRMAAPIFWRDGIIGVLDVQYTAPNACEVHDLVLLRILSSKIALQVATIRATTQQRARIIELKARSDRHKIIHQVGKTIAEGPTIKTAIQKVVDMVATGLRYARTAVLLYDKELEELEVISAHGYGDVEGLRVPVSKGATGYAVRHGEPVNIPDVTTDPRYVKGIPRGRSELVVPILHNNNEVCGVIDVESHVMNAFDAEDIRLLSIVASYTATAIYAAQSQESLEAERRLRHRMALEAKLLSTVNQTLNAIADPDDLCEKSLDLAGEILGWQRSAMWYTEPANGVLVAHRIHGEVPFEVGKRISIGEGTPGKAAKQCDIALVNTAPAQGDDAGGQEQQQPEMAVPIWDEREIIGVLHILGDHAPFTPSDSALLTVFASQVSSAYTALNLRQQKERHLQALDDRTRRLDLLSRVMRSLTRRLKLKELLDELLRLCAEAFDLSHCALLLLDAKQQVLLLEAAIGYDDSAPPEIPIGEGITGYVAATGVPTLAADVSKDPRYIAGVSGGRSEMAVPLRVFGDVIGVLDAESPEEGAFTEDDLDLFACFAAQAATAIYSADLATRLQKKEQG
ncbi:MAG: GAF domain-containing protein [Myxococcota bacterium]|nr:GAF domain-containing protein [Myxococcota bacterium]